MSVLLFCFGTPSFAGFILSTAFRLDNAESAGNEDQKKRSHRLWLKTFGSRDKWFPLLFRSVLKEGFSLSWQNRGPDFVADFAPLNEAATNGRPFVAVL